MSIDDIQLAPATLSHELLTQAAELLDHPASATVGFWARAAAILIRQALEHQVDLFLANHKLARSPRPTSRPPFTTRLLLYRTLHPNPQLAARAAYTWAALSQATHHQGYELPPTAPTLRAWLETTTAICTL